MKVSAPLDLQVDYLIFSTGAGAMDWKNKDLLKKESLSPIEVEWITRVLVDSGYDFMIQKEIPENHACYYHSAGRENHDFYARLEIYRQHAYPLIQKKPDEKASQFVVILPPDAVISQDLPLQLQGLSLIRATSPIDHQSTWLEIFPRNIHKGSGLEWLKRKLNLTGKPTVAIGNDYNDLGMLESVESAWIVSGAPEELKERFSVTSSCEEGGVAAAVETWLQTDFLKR